MVKLPDVPQDVRQLGGEVMEMIKNDHLSFTDAVSKVLNRHNRTFEPGLRSAIGSYLRSKRNTETSRPVPQQPRHRMLQELIDEHMAHPDVVHSLSAPDLD